MEITLAWEGPFGAGCMPDDPARLDALMAAGVYLRIRRYGGRTVSYVGQSVNVLARMDQHLSALLGLQYPLRDNRGMVRLAGDAPSRLAAYNDVAAATALAAEEAARMCFFAAMCGPEFPDDRLNLVEGAIKGAIEARIGGGRAVENRQAIPGDDDAGYVAVLSDFTLLNADSRALLADVLGRKQIALPTVLAEDGFDG